MTELPAIAARPVGAHPIGGRLGRTLADPTTPTTADLPDNTEVGKRFDIAINGRGLMLDRRQGAGPAYRQRLSELEVARFNTDVGNDLNATVDRYHFAGSREFDGGAGQQWANRQSSAENRFWNSHNMDPFQQGAAKPLHAVVDVANTGSYRPRFTVVGDAMVYQTTDRRLALLSAVGATPTVPDDLSSDILDLVSDGRHWFAATASGIVRGTTTSGTYATWSSVAAYEIDYSATRMFAAHTETDASNVEWNVFTSLDSSGNDEQAAAGGVPSGHYRYNADTRIYLGHGIERGRYFYAVAEGNVGSVWAWPISSGDDYQAPVSVLQLPQGTVPTQVFCSGGFVWLRVATLLPNGKCRPAVWQCAVLDDGSLTPQVLIESDIEQDLAVERSWKEFAAHGNYVYFSWASDINEPAFAGAHLIAVSLATGGWAPSYATEGNQSFDCGIWLRRPVFAVENDGSHKIVTVGSAYAAESVIETSIVDGGSDLSKYFAEATVTTTPLEGSWRLRVEASTQRGAPTSWVEKGQRAASEGDPYAALAVNIGGVAAQSMQLRITLESDGAETEAPEINSYQLRYWVASLYDDELLVRIDCKDDVQDRNKGSIAHQTGEGSGIALANWLNDLMNTFVTVDRVDDQFARQQDDYVRAVYEVKDVSSEVMAEDVGKARSEIAAYVTLLMRRSVTLGELGGALIPTPSVAATQPTSGGGGGFELSTARLYPFLAQMLEGGDSLTIEDDGSDFTLTFNVDDTGTARTDEEIRDVVAAFIHSGANVTVNNDDANDRLTISADDTNLSTEQVQDMIAAFLQAGTNVTLDHDDAANTLTISSTGGGIGASSFLALLDTPSSYGTAGQVPVVNQAGDGLTWGDLASAGLTAEQIRDLIASFLVAGTDITIDHDDDNNTLTISVEVTDMTARTDEEIRDVVAAFLREGMNVTIVHDDDGDTLTISASIDKSFVDLTDTPSAISAGQMVVGNAAGTGLTFQAVPTDTNTMRTDEQIRDVIAAFVAEGTDISIVHNDAANTLTFSYTGTPGTGGTSQEEVRDLIGSTLVEGANISITVDDANDTVTIAATDTNTQRTDEDIRDVVGATLVAGANVSIAVDDASDTITISSTDTDTDTNTQRTDEDIRDVVAAQLTEGTNISIVEDDGNDTLTISATDTNTQRTDEDIRDVVGAALVEGTGIDITVDDASDTITIASTVVNTDTQRTDESIRDLVATFLRSGTNITIHHDDAANTLTINSTATGDGTSTDTVIKDTVTVSMERNNPRESAATDTLANSDDSSIFAVGNGSAGSGPPIVGVEALEAVSVRLDYDASSSFDTTDGVTLDIFRGDSRVGYVRGQNFAGTSESANSEDWYWSTDLTVGNDHSSQSGGLNFFDVSGNAIDEIEWPTTGGYLTVRLRNNAITQDDATYGAVTCRFRRQSADFVAAIPSDFTDLDDTPNAITAGQMVVGNTAGDALTFQAVPTFTDTNTQRTDEEIRDVVAAQVTAGTGITVTEDDTNDTLTIASTVVNTDTQRSDEDIRDVVAAMLQAGNNVTLTEDDTNDTLTITATDTNTDTNTQRTDEDIRDVVAAQVRAGTGITVTEDDTNDSLTIASTVVNTDTQRTNEEIRDVIAAALRGGTNVTVVHDDNADTITISSTDTDTQRTNEEIRDLIAGFVHGGTDISVTHDDDNNTLTVAYTGTPGTGGTSEEEVRDLIGSTLVEGANISITVNDAADTVTIAASDTNTQRTDEDIRDVVGTALVGGTNVTVSVDDAADTITISSTDTDTNTQRTDEDIRDVIAATLTAGANITLTEDDAADTLTIAASGGADTTRSDEDIRDVVAAQLTAGANITITEDDANDTLTIASTAGGSGVPATNPAPETVTLTSVTIPHGTGSNEAGVHSAATGNLITNWDASGVTLKAGQYFVEVEAAATGNNYRAAPVMRIEHADTDALLATTTYDYFRDDSAIRENVKLVTALHLTEDTELRFDFRQMQYETDANLGQGVGGAITLTLPTVTFYVTHGTKGDKGDPGTNASARTDEDIRDVVAAMLTAGTNITLTEDDAADTLTVAATFTDTNTQRTDEDIRDVVGTALRAGTNVTIDVDDAADTITINATGGGGGLDQEQVRDTIAAALTDSDEIAWAHNDAADTIRAELKSDSVIAEHLAGLTGVLASDRGKLIALKDDDQTSFQVVDVPTDTNTQRTDEEIRDVVGTALAGGTDISITVDDDNDTITVAYTGTPGTGDQITVSETVPTDPADGDLWLRVPATDDQQPANLFYASVSSQATTWRAVGQPRLVDSVPTGAGDTGDMVYVDSGVQKGLWIYSATASEWQGVGAPTFTALPDTPNTITPFGLFMGSPVGDSLISTSATFVLNRAGLPSPPDDEAEYILNVAADGTRTWMVATGGGSGDDAAAWAEQGDTTAIPVAKLANALAATGLGPLPTQPGNYVATFASGTWTWTNLSAHAGLSQAEVDARIDSKVDSVAHNDNNDVWPVAKLDAEAQATVYVAWRANDNSFTGASFLAGNQGHSGSPILIPERISGNAYLGVWVEVTNADDVTDITSSETGDSLFGDILTRADNTVFVVNGKTGRYWYSSLITEPIEWSEAWLRVDTATTFVERVQQIVRDDTEEPDWYTAPDVPDVADLPSGNGTYSATVSRNGAGDRIVGWGAAKLRLIEMNDTPSAYGTPGQALVLNDHANGLVFGDASVEGIPAAPPGAGEYVLDVPTSGANTWERQGTVDDTIRFDSLTEGMIPYAVTASVTNSQVAGYLRVGGAGAAGSPSAPLVGIAAMTGFHATFSGPQIFTWNSDDMIFDVFREDTRIGSIVVYDTPTSGQVAGEGSGNISLNAARRHNISTSYTTSDTANRKYRARFRDASDNEVAELDWSSGGTTRIRLRQMPFEPASGATNGIGCAATVEFRRTRGPSGAKAQPGRVEAVNAWWGPGQTERVPDDYSDVTGLSRVGNGENNYALRLTWQDPSSGPNEQYFSTADLATLYQSSVATSLNVDAIPDDTIPNDHVFGIQTGLYKITVRADIRGSQDDNRNRLFLMEAQSGADDKLLAATSGVRGQNNFGDLQQGRVLELVYPYFQVGSTTRNLYVLLATGGRAEPSTGFRINRYLMLERYET